MSKSAFETIRARLAARPVTVRGRRYFVAEGDLLLDDAQLIEYAQQRAEALEDPERVPADHSFVDRRRRLLAMTKAGRIVRWRNPQALTYTIDTATFGDGGRGDLVKQSFGLAARAWEDACGVRFEERDHAANEAVFVVGAEDMQGAFIALAFFPTDPPDRRFVAVDPSFFGPLDYDRVGVFRHELGHVLGLRHEHIRTDFVDCDPEPLTDTQEVTPYDSQSVMHYPCSGFGSKLFELTDVDREGARRIYGPPLTDFHLV